MYSVYMCSVYMYTVHMQCTVCTCVVCTCIHMQHTVCIVYMCSVYMYTVHMQCTVCTCVVCTCILFICNVQCVHVYICNVQCVLYTCVVCTCILYICNVQCVHVPCKYNNLYPIHVHEGTNTVINYKTPISIIPLRVVREQQYNKMSYHNLALVFGPTLVRPKPDQIR